MRMHEAITQRYFHVKCFRVGLLWLRRPSHAMVAGWKRRKAPLYNDEAALVCCFAPVVHTTYNPSMQSTRRIHTHDFLMAFLSIEIWLLLFQSICIYRHTRAHTNEVGLAGWIYAYHHKTMSSCHTCSRVVVSVSSTCFMPNSIIISVLVYSDVRLYSHEICIACRMCLYQMKFDVPGAFFARFGLAANDCCMWTQKGWSHYMLESCRA